MTEQILMIGKSNVNLQTTQLCGTINNVYFGCNYMIFSNNHHTNIYAIGNNENGECSVGSEDETIELTLVKYFNKKSINIRKICVSKCSNTTFWISTTNNLYGNGNNNYDQLGIGDYKDRNSPELIFYLKHISDVQIASDFSIALCDNSHELITVITHWSGQHIFKHIPIEILDIILISSGKLINKVYSTPFFSHHGIPFMLKHWKEIDIFSNRHITTIRTGIQHTLFLESNGVIWACGNNNYGELGLSHHEYVSTPTIIECLLSNQIRIRMIACGSKHNIAIDYGYNILSWGNDLQFGQCGHGGIENINSPEFIEHLKGYKIHEIGCGFVHSYCKTSDNEYFLFGGNKYNECLTYNKQKRIVIPFCVNQIFKQCNNGKIIKSIVLGYYNTAVITSVE
eukprot:264159_1